MPGKILSKMFRSLCSRGIKFHHSQSVLNSGREECAAVLPENPEQRGFEDDVPGGHYFSPSPEGAHSYYPPEQHNAHVEIIMLLSGAVDFFINGQWHLLEDNQVHVLLRGTQHTERHYRHKAYSLCWLSCLPNCLTLHRTSYSPEVGYRQSACRVVITPPPVGQLWECGCQRHVDELHYFALLVQCLDIVQNDEYLEQLSGGRDYLISLLNPIRKYLDKNYFQVIDLEELAQMAHCSAVHLNRLFASHYGVTVHRYLAEKRLQEAMRMLRENIPVGETARLTGFADQRYFSRFFRQNTGLTPSEFTAGKQPLDLK